MAWFPTPSFAELVYLLICGAILYTASLTFYRVRLSPVAHIPGTFWAKATFWTEFYWQWIKPGQFYIAVKEMHKEHGPVIRITPDEIHIDDPLFYRELFVSKTVRRTNAYVRYARGTGFEDIFKLVGTHEGHKIIRDVVEGLYSKIGAHEPQVFQCAQKFCKRLNAERDNGRPINLSHACLSLAIEVATTATFQQPSNYLDDPLFNASLFDIQKNGLVHVPLFAHLPFLARIFTSPLIEYLSSKIPELRDWDESIRRQTFRGELQGAAMKLQGRASLWRQSNFASRVGQLIQQNGIFHVSHSIETILTWLAINSHQRQKLDTELAAFWTDHADSASSWFALRELPYLTACIKEGLRMGAGSLNRSPRIFPDDDIVYKEWVIPRGTPISMTTYYMHMDEEVFPNPKVFDPERWLNADPNGLEHAYFLPFAEGSRACAGQNIAWMQMYFAISQLYRPGGPDIELFESDETDVELACGYIFPQPRLESKGVRILVHSPSHGANTQNH